MKQRMILFILGALVISTLILQEPVKFVVSAQRADRIYEMPPSPDCLNIIPDTNFTEAPNFGTNGTSDEFFASFQNSTLENDFNYIELRWEHTPVGSLQLRNDYSATDHEPATWDYAYFSTSFEWRYEILPISCLSVLEFEVECTGDFTRISPELSLFQVLVLVVDSSGKVARLHSEDSLRNASYGYYSNQLSSWIIGYAWDSMIEDDLGRQDAPTDVAEVMVVLAPTSQFFVGPEAPVYTFDGTVSIRCRYFDLQVLVDLPPSVEVSEPVAIGSFSHNTSINYVEMAVNPNGSVFCLGRTYLMPDWGVIVRWSIDAQPIWAEEWQDDAPGAITVTDDRIYTVGQQNDDLSLALWSLDGDLIQEFFYNISNSDFGVDVSVISTGEVFILGYSRYQTEYTPFLIKLNPDFSIKTIFQFSTTNYRGTYRFYITDSGNGYAQIGNSLIRINDEIISDSDIDFNAESFVVTDNGNLWYSSSVVSYTTPLLSIRKDLQITKIDPMDSTESQSLFIRFKYSPIYYDSSWHSSIATDENERSIYTLSYKGLNFVQYLLVKTDIDGSVIWIKSIENRMTNAWPDDWNVWHQIHVLNETRICVAGTDFQSNFRKLTFAIIDIGNPPWFENIDWILVGSIIGVVVVVDIVLVVYFKRRTKPPSKQKADLGKLFDDVFKNA